MAIEAALEGLYIGADHVIELTVYTSAAQTACQDVTGWATVLDIRAQDRSADPALVSKTGTVSGTFNATPASNTQKISFTLSDDDLAASVFKGDGWSGRYSIWRTDAGSEQPLAFGAVTITRLTRT